MLNDSLPQSSIRLNGIFGRSNGVAGSFLCCQLATFCVASKVSLITEHAPGSEEKTRTGPMIFGILHVTKYPTSASAALMVMLLGGKEGIEDEITKASRLSSPLFM